MILDECISNLDDDVRQAGLNALRAFSNAFYSNNRYRKKLDACRRLISNSIKTSS